MKKLTWDLLPFYEKLTENAMKSYEKHASKRSFESKSKTNENANFFSNFPDFLKGIFGIEKQTSKSYVLSEEIEDDLHKKMEILKNEEPFSRKHKNVEKIRFHLNKGMIPPDFNQVNPIFLQSETDILVNESVINQ